MLQKLSIRNYAIIDELAIAFDDELNVITGETGAGKSIILGALSLILGERADTSVLINKEEKCIVEAYFDVNKNDPFKAKLESEDLDVEPVCIIRREISAAGKSRAFVNDTPVTLQVLNGLAVLLVDLHRQFDTRALLEDNFLYEVMDAVAGTQNDLKVYQKHFKVYKDLQQQYRQIWQQQEQWNREADYKQFLFDELETAGFKENEIEETELQLKALSHAEQIKTTLQGAYYALEESETPLNNELKKVGQQLQAIAAMQAGADDLAKRMDSVLIELRDIADSLDALQSKVDMNPEALQSLQERMDMGYKLLKKHNVQTSSELLDIRQQLSVELEAKNHAEAELEKLKAAIQAAEKDMSAEATALSEKRKKAMPGFEKKLNELLKLVGMPNASLKIEITAKEHPDENGCDSIAFLLDANKSGQFLPIQKSASGGELSRIMLCIKTLTAKAMQLPTLIFDEVDTGISGEAARQVGILLRNISNTHQVVCITHQPQVAGKGTRHFYVYKSEEGSDAIKTKVRVLDEEEHIKAIAQMIGGDKPSEAAIENARELAGN